MTLAQAALDELTRRRAHAAQQVARGANRKEAEANIALWCGIAAWHGAVLPEECRVQHVPIWPDQRPRTLFVGDSITDGFVAPGANGTNPLQSWTDHAPRLLPAGDWLVQLATECRRAAVAALHHYEELGQTQQAKAQANRACTLLSLERPISLAAGLGPFPVSEAERKAA